MEHTLTITIPGSILPLERGERFADPLDAALQSEKLGATGDEGTQMDENFQVIAGDIEVTVSDLPRGLSVIRRVLREQAAPPGTTITQHEPEKIIHAL